MRRAYDLVIIGAGAAGSEAAFAVADGGKTSILLVEANHFGGTCTNHGCVPTKALVKAGKVAQAMRTAAKYGLEAVEPRFDWSKVIGRADEVRDHMLRHGPEPFREAGVEVAYPSRARLLGEHRLQVDGRELEARAVLLACGLEPLIPPIPGLEESGYLDNQTALELEALPRRLAVLGAGPIGSEFAQIFARFGVEVTVLEAGERMLPPEEPESGEALRQAFGAEGITVRTAAKLERVSLSGAGRRLELAGGSAVEVDSLLVAVGRELQGDALGLDAAGVEWTPKGVRVDAHLRTSAPWVYAAGDIVGGLLFTHTATAMGGIAARNALAVGAGGGTEIYDPRIVPRVTFTEPEVASVGSTERQAVEAGHSVKVGMALVKDAEKAQIDGQTIGHVKVVADEDGQLLGCHIVCEAAGEMIHEAVAIMAGRLPIAVVAAEMHAYPTLSELLRSALSKAAG
ncbi:MAG: FAD-dependent oxidoreductase [Chloroflexi bacterium]|nr:MAG: FAD-dependent oxidoreductase [Chloroflexota bacterium]TMD53624.1 MAG: FAD-dependent oxidoreductase [Chloroflexota bacterium]